MHVLIAHFNYEGMTEQEFLVTAKDLAPNFASIPGCFEKTWLIDAGKQTAGGVYKFRDRQSIDAYLASELWAGVKSTPEFTNLVTEIHGVMEDATTITNGLPAALAR